MKTRIDKSVCSWWNGPCLFEALDAVEVPLRDPKGPFRWVIFVLFHSSLCWSILHCLLLIGKYSFCMVFKSLIIFPRCPFSFGIKEKNVYSFYGIWVSQFLFHFIALRQFWLLLNWFIYLYSSSLNIHLYYFLAPTRIQTIIFGLNLLFWGEFKCQCYATVSWGGVHLLMHERFWTLIWNATVLVGVLSYFFVNFFCFLTLHYLEDLHCWIQFLWAIVDLKLFSDPWATVDLNLQDAYYWQI